MEWFIINLLNCISYGMILFLIGSGLSIVLGAMGIANLAHGAIYIVAVKWHGGCLPGLLVGAASAGLVGFAIERGLLRHLYRQLNEPYGLALVGIREDESRMRAVGYDTWLYKYTIFVITGAFAGIAGVLFMYYNFLYRPSTWGW